MFQKKSLGQNFLKNHGVVAKIVAAGNLAAGEWVLEIGPGKGVLTAELLKTGAKVHAIEKDHRLIPELQAKFERELASGQLTLTEGDILHLSPEKLRFSGDFKLIANIPYYITGEIMRLALEEWAQKPTTSVLLVQKEVAKRITDREKGSILGLSVHKFAIPEYITTVPANMFSPAPKVDSAVIRLTRRPTPLKYNLLIVKKGFAHPRKKLSSNLEISDQILIDAGLSPMARAEDLSTPEWERLSDIL